MKPIFRTLFLSLAMLLCMSSTACGQGFSEGERAGYVVKFSKKGLFMKSYEGELRLSGGGLGGVGTADSGWHFTVIDESVVPAVLEAAESGDRVTLIYKQWLVSPLGMDTDYEVVGVKVGGKLVPVAAPKDPPKDASTDLSEGQ